MHIMSSQYLHPPISYCTIAMPHHTHTTTVVWYTIPPPYIHGRPTPHRRQPFAGIMYLVKNGVGSPAPDILLRTVFIDGWPFFALFILVAAYGAIAMWMLVSTRNGGGRGWV